MIINEGEKVIVVNVCGLQQAHFFSRFIKAGLKKNLCLVFFTYQYSVYLYLRKLVGENNVIFIKDEHFNNGVAISKENVDRDLEVLLGMFSIPIAKELYNSTFTLLNMIGAENIELLWCWNGQKVIDHAMADFAKRHNIHMLYFEIANIEGKIFVDPQGTNCESYLYKNGAILNCIKIDSERYLAWKKQYIANKFQEVTIKQAKKDSIKSILNNYLLDMKGYFLHHGVVSRKVSLRFWHNRVYKIPYHFTKIDFEKIDFVFFPLQVSTDTQV